MPEVSRRQERKSVGWDAADWRNGGVERTVWDTLLEMEQFDCRAAEMDHGAITQVLLSRGQFFVYKRSFQHQIKK